MVGSPIGVPSFAFERTWSKYENPVSQGHISHHPARSASISTAELYYTSILVVYSYSADSIEQFQEHFNRGRPPPKKTKPSTLLLGSN